jgi:hypothetical protein
MGGRAHQVRPCGSYRHVTAGDVEEQRPNTTIVAGLHSIRKPSHGHAADFRVY